eukprot:GHVL01023102.1.p1 GENE.GHVL01023102.1~~GHVL01023102.1.p1  ORF type:complete len:194 (+),score=39.28 GHVL01023102.1:73-654(+)
MTTAHRPTWAPAVGGNGQGGNRMLAPTTKLHSKDQPGQTTLKSRPPIPEVKKAFEEKKQAEEAIKNVVISDSLFPEDADYDLDAAVEDSDEDESDEEDTAALLRELENIKREQEEELRKKADTEKEKESAQRRAEILVSNPLLNQSDIILKRRWDDDIVFRNQSKTLIKPQKRFINDTVRSDFHRKFLGKYIQ